MTIADKTEKTTDTGKAGGGSAGSDSTEDGRTGARGRPKRLLVGGWRRITAMVLAGLVLVALVVYIVLTALHLHTRSVVAENRVAGEAAARSGVEKLLSYDSANLDPTRAAIDQVATGGFHDQFLGVFTQVVSPNAIQQKATSQATVRASGVVSADPDHVVVLLFINQSTTSNQLPAPRVDTIQTRVTMTPVDGRWLISGLDQL